MRFRQWLGRVMAGRYGTDQLNRFLAAATLVLLILSLFTGGTALGKLVWILALVCLVSETYRTFSRRIDRRRAENEKYLRLTRGIRDRVGDGANRFRQRKDYRFFRCPSCRTVLRVPRGKGKLSITCRQCGERFIRKT